jgi:hypothetical protein
VLPEEPLGNGLSTVVTSAWPIEEPDHDVVGAELYFSRFVYIGSVSVGLARADIEDPAPARVLMPPDQLFVPPSAAGAAGTPAEVPTLFNAARRDGSMFYAYLCNMRPDAVGSTDPRAYVYRPCRLARVPAALIQDGTSYEYWSDGTWVPELARASVVIDGVPSGLTVRHNAFLNKQLAVHSGDDNNVHLAWSDELQGPFHAIGAPVPTVIGSGGALPWSSAASELPVPHGECDREILVAYTLPVNELLNDGMSRVHFEVHVMRLRFDQP